MSRSTSPTLRIIHMSTSHKERRRLRLEGCVYDPDWRPLTACQRADLEVMQDIDLAVATGEPHWIAKHGLEATS